MSFSRSIQLILRNYKLTKNNSSCYDFSVLNTQDQKAIEDEFNSKGLIFSDTSSKWIAHNLYELTRSANAKYSAVPAVDIFDKEGKVIIEWLDLFQRTLVHFQYRNDEQTEVLTIKSFFLGFTSDQKIIERFTGIINTIQEEGLTTEIKDFFSSEYSVELPDYVESKELTGLH